MRRAGTRLPVDGVMTTFLIVFAVTYAVALLLSGYANRTPLSLAVLFLVVGFVSEPGVLGLLSVRPSDAIVSSFALVALLSVLVSDGLKLSARTLTRWWRLPTRALVLGIPLTIGVIGVFAHFVAQVPWLQGLLLGAVLSPTDPVFASAIVALRAIPERVRSMLNIESGMNDGLALPAVLLFLALSKGEPVVVPRLVGEPILGTAIGVIVPLVLIRIGRFRFVTIAAEYHPREAFGFGLLAVVLAAVAHGNVFLAAFAAGVTMATIAPEIGRMFETIGSTISDLLKLATLLLFGAFISPNFLREVGVDGYVFALVTILFARPIAFALAMLGSQLTRREWLTAAWFGPRGFASAVYAIMLVSEAAPHSDRLFHLTAIVVVGSIIKNTSTEVWAARQYQKNRTYEGGGRLEEGLGVDE
ncbi:MAG TPA: cation:proton antiporter [Gemmatimonadaceae bacterium]|nr:cation:proton antiporter [Gemmatimonadaceae bacterium]